MKRFLCMLLLCLLAVPALAESLPDQGLGFITDAGIAADSVVLMGNELVVTLTNGGAATLYTYGDFDMFDLSWRFDGASDGDVALYLDYALSLLAGLEEKIPADTENLSSAEAMRARNYAVMVSNGLLYLERVGQQGLNILLEQLSRHDNSGLNSLRARLASRLLGALDNSPVDPAEGLAWYDALEISVQDDLPLPEASVYVEDPFLAEVTQMMIAHEEDERADYTWGSDVIPDRTTTFVYLSSVTARIDGDRATIFAHVASEKIALYNGLRLRTLSGGWYPRRIDLIRVDDQWMLTEITAPGDGTEYWPSIVAFCDGDEALASTLTSANTPELHEEYEAALTKWLTCIRYPEVE